jgi:hypothetical protein
VQHRWLRLVVLILAARTVQAGPLDRDATLFGPVTEWSVENSTFTGNPFNLEATVTFQHDASGEVRTGQMFYDAANTWRFRFTGTRTGAWRFTTSSADGDLSGLSGTVMVAAGADPVPRGFLVAADSKFARQVGETGLKGEALHVYMNMREPTETNPGFGINDSSGGWTPVNRWDEPSERAAYIAQATDNGLDAIFLQMNAQWFEANVSDANDLRSTNPDTTTFLALEQLITEAHAAGVQVVIWAWGDDARKWTPNFAPLDGQNGSADRRLQRYIAARLGPLPGWSMGYGFDLEEWASEAELQSWADSLHAQMGWDHLLWGRRRRNADLNAVSNDLRPDGNPADEFYQMAVAELNNSGGRPVIFERRFGYLRDGVWTAGRTRRAMWQFTMAGGAAGWFGFRAGSSITAPGPYPNPEQLQTHDAFWEDRLLVNMARHNELAPDDLAWALATPDLDHIVVYAQSTDHIALNLEAIGAPLTAVAIDAKGAYLEIQVGQFQPSTTHWDAPYTSDWALAIDVRVPEPASVGLLFIGSAILAVRSRRRWRNKSSETRSAMCRGIFCFVLCLGLAGAASADLVGYWPLDGDGMDASAGESNGTVQGDVEAESKWDM